MRGKLRVLTPVDNALGVEAILVNNGHNFCRDACEAVFHARETFVIRRAARQWLAVLVVVWLTLNLVLIVISVVHLAIRHVARLAGADIGMKVSQRRLTV